MVLNITRRNYIYLANLTSLSHIVLGYVHVSFLVPLIRQSHSKASFPITCHRTIVFT